VDTPAAATPPPPKKEGVEAFKIGDLSATALRDGGIELPNDNKVFGVGHTPGEVAALLSAAGLPTDKLQLSIQPLLVKTADRVLLFDTGAGSNFGPGAGQLPTSLASAGIDPNSVTDIFISHVHGDHVGGLVNAQGALAFPNATIHLSKPEWAYLSGMKPDAAKSVGLAQYGAFIAAITPKVAAFAPGAELIPGVVKATEITGHTPGHSGYTITSGENSLVYVGDSMHHFVVSVQKPDWACGFDGDAKTAAESRGALLSRLAASGQRVYSVHFPFPGIGKIEKRGEGLVWVAE
jgi:glyoxylase-like metal-dependent hydrolase (beta-lactamase superfamily II)